MKSKAKRNHNRPASFREKCRNAFGGALKGLADINAAEKENVAASFDLDKRSVERRIDAMEKNRAVAKRIAEDCIKGNPTLRISSTFSRTLTFTMNSIQRIAGWCRFLGTI